MHGIGVIAVGGRQVGLQLRLQIGGVELRQHLARVHLSPSRTYTASAGSAKRALHRHVLIGRDDAGQAASRLDRAVARDGGLDVRSGCGGGGLSGARSRRG